MHFAPANEFKQHMDHWIRGFRNAKTIDGEEKVLVPGDPEREMQVIREKGRDTVIAGSGR